MSKVLNGPALVVIPPSTAYQVASPNVEETWMFLHRPTRWHAWLDLPELLPGIRVIAITDPRFQPALDAVHASGDDQMLRDNACERLLLVARPRLQRHRLVEAAVRHLEADLSARHDLAGLARAVGGSRSRVAEVFAQEMGMPPMAWLEHRRIAVACGLLVSTGDSVQEIAAAVGYANPFHFSTRFRHHLGQAPSLWRSNPGRWP